VVASKPPRIGIDGVFLDDVRTRVHYDREANVVSYTSLPAHRHGVLADGAAVVVRTQAVTALQLYHDGVLPGDAVRGVDLAVGGETLGRFVVDSLRCARDRKSGQHVLLRFVPVEPPSSG